MLDSISYDYSRECAYIYQITFNKNGYIGSTLNPRQRMMAHRSYLSNNRHPNPILQNAWNKYGEENFKFNVICKCKIEDRNSVEEFYINKSKYNSRYNIAINCNEPILSMIKNKKLNKDDVVNIFKLVSDGESLVDICKLYNISKEMTRAIIFKKIYKLESKNLEIDFEKYKKDRNINKSKAQIRDANIDVFVYKISGEFIGRYGSIIEISRDLGFKRGDISNALGRNQVHCGYMFFREAQSKIMYRENYIGARKVILEFDKDFNKINEYISMIDCGNKNGLKSNTINSNCNRMTVNSTTGTYFIRKYRLDLFYDKYKITDNYVNQLSS